MGTITSLNEFCRALYQSAPRSVCRMPTLRAEKRKSFRARLGVELRSARDPVRSSHAGREGQYGYDGANRLNRPAVSFIRTEFIPRLDDMVPTARPCRRILVAEGDIDPPGRGEVPVSDRPERIHGHESVAARNCRRRSAASDAQGVALRRVSRWCLIRARLPGEVVPEVGRDRAGMEISMAEEPLRLSTPLQHPPCGRHVPAIASHCAEVE